MRVCVCMSASARVCERVYECVCASVSASARVCVRVRACVCESACECVCVSVPGFYHCSWDLIGGHEKH